MQFMFSGVPSPQPDGQIQKQQAIKTPVTKNYQRNSDETGTEKANKNTLKS